MMLNKQVYWDSETLNDIALDYMVTDQRVAKEIIAALTQRVMHAEILRDITAASVTVTELAPLFEMALEHLIVAFQLDGAFIKTSSLHVTRNLHHGVDLIHPAAAGQKLPERDHIAISDIYTSHTANQEYNAIGELVGRLGMRSALYIALNAHDVCIGSMLLCSAFPRFWSSEEVVLVEAVCHQLGATSDRLQYERDLRASQKRHQVLSEIIADYASVYQMRADGHMELEWDRGTSLLHLVGYTVDEVTALGGPISVVVPEDRKTAALSWMPGGPSSEAEFRVQCKDGQIRWIRRTTHMDNDSSDPFIIGYLFETITDITKQKEIQNQAAALAMEHERAQILSRFIQDASHEFRTPLYIISLNVHLLKQTCLDEKQLKRLMTVCEQVKLMSGLVESLLTLAQLDSTEDHQMQSVNLGLLVNAEVEAQQAVASTKGLTFALDVCTDLPEISGETEYVSLAIRHILNNAIRYTEAGGVFVQLSRQEDQVVVEVRDTGVGMTQETKTRIFERFYRLDDAHSDVGLGLGLPIVQKVMEQHGGVVTVDSKLGIGTAFRLHFPLIHPTGSMPLLSQLNISTCNPNNRIPLTHSRHLAPS